MMFKVRWEKEALNELTALWLHASPEIRKAITAATNEIDQQLSLNPLRDSESRQEGRRILFSFPLGVVFRVEDDARTVSVLKVWLFKKRSTH
jgi:mRNA-degrading endonuclease RelE of RelBE toxin-antitoxin system